LQSCPPLRQDARQQLARRFGVRVRLAPCLRQLALNRRLQHGGAVLLQAGAGTLQRGYARIEPRELLLDGGDDAALLGEGSDWDAISLQRLSIDACNGCPIFRTGGANTSLRTGKKVSNIGRINAIVWSNTLQVLIHGYRSLGYRYGQ